MKRLTIALLVISSVLFVAPVSAEAGPLCNLLQRAKARAGQVLGVQRRQERRASRQASYGRTYSACATCQVP